VQESDAVTPLFRLRLTLELVVATKRIRIPLDLNGRKETIHIPLPSRPRYVALDPEHDVLKLMEFPRSVDQLLYGLKNSGFALERIRCARELASAGGEVAVGALFRSARTDRFWGVRIAATVSLGEIGHRVTGLSDRIAALAAGQHTRVRRAVIWALGWIGDDAALRALKRFVSTETSSFNTGLALLGIARAGKPGAFEALHAEVGRETHRDMLRFLIFDGMAQLKDPRAIPVLLEHTEPRFRNEGREAATKALGKLGVLDPRVERRLGELLRDPWFRVRSAAAGSLQKLKSPRAEGTIREALQTEVMDTVRHAFERALDEARAAR